MFKQSQEVPDNVNLSKRRMSKNTVLYQYVPYNNGFEDGEMPMCPSNYDYKLINTIFESYATYDGLADDDVKKLRVMLFPWILYSGEAIFEEMQGELFQMNIDFLRTLYFFVCLGDYLGR